MPTALGYADLILATRYDINERKWTDLSYDLQEHVAARMILTDKKVKTITGSVGKQFNIVKDHNHQAEWITPGQVRSNVDISDTLAQATVPWRHLEGKFSVIRQFMNMNKGDKNVLVDYIKQQRHAGMTSMWAAFETAFWSKPTDSTDEKTMWGIGMFIVAGTSATPAIDGGNPAGFTSGYAGVNFSTVPRWGNWSAIYTQVSRTDFIAKLREMLTKTKYRAPVSYPPNAPMPQRFGLYAPYATIGALELAAEDQNTNLGNDLASKDGKVMVRQIPVDYVPQLDGVSTQPLYGIDWASVEFIALKGENMAEKVIDQNPAQPDVITTFVDLTGNPCCTDRRRQFILSK